MSVILSSTNALTLAYASVSRRLAAEVQTAATETEAREKTVAAIAMAVACVETYMNVFARLWLTQTPTSPIKEEIERDLRTKKGLGRKLEEWPQVLLGQPADLGSGPGQRFKVLLTLRNRLMHFLPDTHDFSYENVTIRGLIDTSDFIALSSQQASEAVAVAEEFVAYLLALQGITPEQVPYALHHWLGKLPSAAQPSLKRGLAA